MIRVKIIGFDKVNWSIDKDQKNLSALLSKIPEVKLTDSFWRADIIYFLWYEQILYWRFRLAVSLLKIFKRVKVVAVITNNIEGNERVFARLRGIVDKWISPNGQVTRFLEKKAVSCQQLPFFVSQHVFDRLRQTRAELSAAVGIDNTALADKVIIGSFQRDSLGKNLCLPKWQKNPDLLIKICRLLPADKYVLLLAGPRRHYIIHLCRKYQIPYVFVGDESYVKQWRDDIAINNLPEEKINVLYNLSDVYLVTSRSEGGPKAILEAALAETMIFSTPVGLAPDFLPDDLLFQENDVNKVVRYLSDFFSRRDETVRHVADNHRRVAAVLGENNYLKSLSRVFTQIK